MRGRECDVLLSQSGFGRSAVSVVVVVEEGIGSKVENRHNCDCVRK